MIHGLWRLLRDLISLQGTLGVLVASLPLVTLLSLGLLPYARYRRGRLIPWPVQVSFGLLALGEACAFVVSESSRRHFSRLLTGVDHDNGVYVSDAARHLSSQLTAELLATSAAAVAIPLLSAIVLGRRSKAIEPGSRATGWVCPVAMACMAWTTSVLGWHMAASMRVTSFHLSPEAVYDQCVASFGVADVAMGRLIVLSIAMVATCAVIATFRAARPDRSVPSVAWGASLLVLGGLAYAWTRDLAFDARRPLSYSDRVEPRSGSVDLPPATHCASPTSGPLLELACGGARLDGAILAIDDVAETLSLKRQLWRQTHPGRTVPNIALAVSPEVSTEEVLPFVLSAREAGYSGVELLVAPPKVSVKTHTLGTVDRTPHLCSVLLPADVAMGESWGALAARLQVQNDAH